jgi:hypothetical protein
MLLARRPLQIFQLVLSGAALSGPNSRDDEVRVH